MKGGDPYGQKKVMKLKEGIGMVGKTSRNERRVLAW